MPKLTKSVSESSSFPNSEVPFINLAILPSNASSIAAKIIKITAKLKFPSNANFIELIPRHTPPNVRIFGRRYLVFFEVTNLNFFFFHYSEAIKLSPATTF